MKKQNTTRRKAAPVPAAGRKAAPAPAAGHTAVPAPPYNRAMNDAVLQLARLASSESSRFTLSAIRIEADKAVVTDGHQLTVCDLAKQDFDEVPAIPGMEIAQTWQPFLLHKDTALEMAKTLSSKAAKDLPACGNVYVGASTSADKRIVQVGATDLKRPKVLTSEAMPGNFPEYERLIPKDPDYQIAVDAELLGRVLDYARRFHQSNSKTLPTVILSFWRHTPGKESSKWRIHPFTVEALNAFTGQRMKSVVMPVREDTVVQSAAMQGAPQLVGTPAPAVPPVLPPPPPEPDEDDLDRDEPGDPDEDEVIEDDEAEVVDGDEDEADDEAEVVDGDEDEADDDLPRWPGLPVPSFPSRIRAAQSLDQARTILSEHEQWLNQMDRAAGFTPVVGEVEPAYKRGFSTVTRKEQREWIRFYSDEKIEQKWIDELTALISQGNEAHEIFNDMLRSASRRQDDWRKQAEDARKRAHSPVRQKKQPVAKSPTAPTASRASGANTPTILGHPVSSILRWLGREQLTGAEAEQVLAAYGVSCPSPTIRDNIGAGRPTSPRYDESRIPHLTQRQAAELLSVVGKRQARQTAPKTTAALRRR